jgi:hypothetical protein
LQEKRRALPGEDNEVLVLRVDEGMSPGGTAANEARWAYEATERVAKPLRKARRLGNIEVLIKVTGIV